MPARVRVSKNVISLGLPFFPISKSNVPVIPEVDAAKLKIFGAPPGTFGTL